VRAACLDKTRGPVRAANDAMCANRNSNGLAKKDREDSEVASVSKILVNTVEHQKIESLR